MDILKAEFARNISAYFLAIGGVLTAAWGGHMHFDKLVDVGVAFATASLLAFQAKRSPDGNTTTTSVTVPPPEVAPTPAIPATK